MDQQKTEEQIVAEVASTDDQKPAEDSTLPTHWSKLDFNKLKVPELRAELDARSLDSKGIKSQLVQRLQQAVKAEEQQEKAKAEAEEAAKAPAESTTEKPAEAQEEPKKPEERKPEKSAAELAREERERQRQKEKEERDRKNKREQLQRHYSLGKDPQPGLLVFPHTTAKSGKFDCKVVSLSTLLDYRIEDNKEHSFEVSLFAEMFSAMLTRDFAFKIYKTLLAAPDLAGEQKRKIEDEKRAQEAARAAKEADEANKLAEANSSEAKPNQNGETVEIVEEAAELQVKDEVKEETEADQALKESSSHEPDEKKASEKDNKEKQTSQSKNHEKKATVVSNPDVLLAFNYFDINNAGYIVDKDLEDILHSLGLHNTRSQVQRLLKKLILKGDTLSYRKLTDATKIKSDAADAEAVLQPALQSKDPGFVLPGDEEISRGNVPLFSLPSRGSAGRVSVTAVANGGVVDVTMNPTVMFQGAVIDLAQVVAQLQRMETEQKAVEQKNCRLEKELKSSKDQVDSLDRKRRRLDEDLKDTKKKLGETEKFLKNSKDDTIQLKTTLGRCKENAETIIRQIDRALPKKEEPKKESKKEEASTSKAPANAAQLEQQSPALAAENAEQQRADAEPELEVRDEIVENDKPEADMES